MNAINACPIMQRAICISLLILSHAGLLFATVMAVYFLTIPSLLAAASVAGGAAIYIVIGRIAWRKIKDLK
jgi:hypothetical protein